jgi:uncharacterized membrane protein (DUF373 family)
MEAKDKFLKINLTIANNLIRALIVIMTLILILGVVDLLYLIYNKVINQQPYFLIDVTTLFDVFSLVLIIAVGYELIKSLILIIYSDTIPSLPIIEIAIIAVSNKIITLDVKHTDYETLFGLAALIGALGITHFLLKFNKKKETKITT